MPAVSSWYQVGLPTCLFLLLNKTISSWRNAGDSKHWLYQGCLQITGLPLHLDMGAEGCYEIHEKLWTTQKK